MNNILEQSIDKNQLQASDFYRLIPEICVNQ